MRADTKLPAELRASSDWQSDTFGEKQSPNVDSRRMGMGLRVDGKLYTYSLSGSERNHLFMGQRGTQFVDSSLVSGLDVIADSRSFAVFDYDRDGWQDIALVNANTPLLNLFHNDFGTLEGNTSKQRIAIRLVGGNDSKNASSLTCRDGIGAVVKVTLGNMTLVRERHCGEGLAAQNSPTMLIGIGERQAVDSVEVVWPSGRQQEIEEVPANSLVTVHEMSSRFDVQPYRRTVENLSARIKNRSRQSTTGLVLDIHPEANSERTAALRMYTTMATWCPSCKKSIPQLQVIRNHFNSDSLDMFGIPADPAETSDELADYQRQHRPPYAIVTGMNKKQLTAVARILNSLLPSVALPSTIVTDSHGRVLQSFLGIPSVSDLGKLLSDVNRS